MDFAEEAQRQGTGMWNISKKWKLTRLDRVRNYNVRYFGQEVLMVLLRRGIEAGRRKRRK